MRLIDADALRESIITRQTEMSYEDAWALTCVDNAPTIEPQKWISASKELPKEKDELLVTVSDEYLAFTDTDQWTGAKFWGYGDKVVAWQPFPEPWKGEE